MPRQITRELAAYAVESRFADLPQPVQAEAARAFLNWMGCVFGGCHEPAVAIAADLAAEIGARPQATVIGRGFQTDLTTAAFLNCLSSSVPAFDDTHLATITHPTGPVAAALFAYCERQPVSGEDFLNALALGIEVTCRMSNVLLLPPATPNLGFYVTGLTGPIGAAAALGRLLRLNQRQMISALGLAAAQGSGFRDTHATMAASLVPAQAARNGVTAAMLAAKGFTSSDRSLESGNGFIGVFSFEADPGHALEGLGHRYELLANTCKPYPCAAPLHPIIDACLDIADRLDGEVEIASVALEVHPLAQRLTWMRDPKTPLEAQVSLHHWAAAALLHCAAGLPQMRQRCLDDPAVASLRQRITASSNPALRRDQATIEVTLANGLKLRARVDHARGSRAKPMSDAELDSKFRVQTCPVLGRAETERLLALCRNAAALSNVGNAIAACWAEG
jgi:2-methylcitrate dehydratase PrpD